MLDPFKLTFRLFVAMLAVGGYLFVFFVQIFWYVVFNRRDKVGDAFGDFGRGFVDTIAGAFRD